MSIEVVNATEEHRQLVAERVAARVQELVAAVPVVPNTLAHVDGARAALESLDDRLLVAVDSDDVVGHLGWHEFPDTRRTGRRGAWMPEFAHSAEDDCVRDALFAHAARRWEHTGRQTLMVTTLIDEPREWWHLNGFGTFLHDTVRAPAAVQLQAAGTLVRPAATSDAPALEALDVQHCAHYAEPPTFMVAATPWSAHRWQSTIEERPGLVQVAVVDGALCGFVRVEFGHAELRLLDDPRSATITGIFVRPDGRGTGVGAALVAAAADAAGAAGAHVLTADHETTNPTARRFWPRHTTTVAVSLMRVLERW